MPVSPDSIHFFRERKNPAIQLALRYSGVNQPTRFNLTKKIRRLALGVTEFRRPIVHFGHPSTLVRTFPLVW
jgi:hypothetical protein